MFENHSVHTFTSRFKDLSLCVTRLPVIKH
jgi:hypothetical protein